MKFFLNVSFYILPGLFLCCTEGRIIDLDGHSQQYIYSIPQEFTLVANRREVSDSFKCVAKGERLRTIYKKHQCSATESCEITNQGLGIPTQRVLKQVGEL